MPPRIEILQSPQDLRDAAAPWDELWRRSACTTPTARASGVADFVERFAPRREFRALIVEDGGRFAAALPLVETPLARICRVGGLPSNEWWFGATPLFDPEVDTSAVLRVLLEGLQRLPWPLLWLEGVRMEPAVRAALLAAMGDAAMPYEWRDRRKVGVIPIEGDWESRQRQWSRNHRKNTRRGLARLEREGDLQFQFLAPRTADEAVEGARRAFELEDRGWKGDEGTSVKQTPGMLDFYCRQAEQLASTGELRLAFLEHDGRTIAFEYGWQAKETYHSLKVGYEPSYASYSPGQLLVYCLLERFHRTGEARAIDCLGPLSPFVERWRPDSYTLGRLAIAARGAWNRLLLPGYLRLRPRWDRLRGRSAAIRPHCNKR